MLLQLDIQLGRSTKVLGNIRIPPPWNSTSMIHRNGFTRDLRAALRPAAAQQHCVSLRADPIAQLLQGLSAKCLRSSGNHRITYIIYTGVYIYIHSIHSINMIKIYCIVLVIILILSGGVATIFDRVILLDAFWGLQNESLKPSRHIRLAFCACLFFHCTRRIHRRLREPGSDATGDQHGWRDDALRSLWHCPLG